jgi:hypothetical protein
MKPKRTRRIWSAPDLRRLIKLYATHPTNEIAHTLNRTVSGIYGMAKKLGLNKTQAFIHSEASRARLRKGSRVGEAYRFKKGHVPANKGMRRPGWYAGRMRETQFKKGNRSHTWKPVGTIRADSEGFLHLKVRERLPGDAPGWNPEVWPMLHHQVWRDAKGPIPPGHIVTFKDRNRSNCAIENLELMSKADNARRNAIWNRYPAELCKVIMLNGALKRKLRRQYGKEHDGGPSGPSIRDPRSAEGSGQADGGGARAGGKRSGANADQQRKG